LSTIKLPRKIDLHAQRRAVEKELCERNLSAFIRRAWHVIEPGQPYVHNWHIDLICAHLEAITDGVVLEDGSPYNRLLINVPPGPMRHDSVVETARGQVALSDVRIGDFVLTHMGRYREVSAVHDQGILPILRIVTNSGRVTHAAPSHPYLTPCGWVDAKDLSVGDVLAAVNRHEDRPGVRSIQPEEARLLGYLIGDGSLTQATAGFTNADREVIDDFRACATALGFETAESWRNSHWHVRLNGRTRVKAWLADHGLVGASSYTKRIPAAVMSASVATLREFLGAYWTCDGGFDVRPIGSRGSKFRAYATTVSEGLADDLVAALGLVGIESRLRRKARPLETASQPGGVYRSFSIEVQNEAMTARLADFGGLCSRKRALAEQCRRGFDRPLWNDEIVSIEQSDPSHCLCLTVEEDHSFTCSGIAVKNSMKSLILNVFWPAWEWGPRNMPHLRYVCAAHSQTLAVRDSTKMRRLVQSDWYHGYWGDRVKLMGDQNAKTKFENSATGFREAIAAGSITGARGDRILCFPADELVHSEGGLFPIGALVRDRSKVKVWSADPLTGETTLKRIEGWHINPASDLVEVTLSDGSTFQCTPNHRIWTRSGWVEAALLQPGHRVPRSTIPDHGDGFLVNAISPSQSALAFGTRKYLKDLGIVELAISHFHSFVHIASLPNPFRYAFPSFATPNLFNSSAFHTVSFRKFVGVGSARGDRGSMHARKDSARTLFKKRERSVSFGVRNVLSARSIFEVVKARIISCPVSVTNLLAYWTRPYKSAQNLLMDKELRSVSSPTGIKTRISFSLAQFKDFLGNSKRSSPSSVNDASMAFDAAKITYAVKPFKTLDRNPVLVRKIGHRAETFCLTVQDNHTFFVGNGEGVLVANCDDPHSVEGAASDAMRNTTLEWFTEAVPTRLNNPATSAIVVIMQRLHEEDVSGVILERKGYAGLWDAIILPMRFEVWRKNLPTKLGYVDPREVEGELLFEERFSEKTVTDLENSLGPYATAGQLQQTPMPRGGGIIKDEWWRKWPDNQEYPPCDYIVGSLDTAYTEKQENDFSAMTIWGVFTTSSKATPTKVITREGQILSFQERVYQEGAPNVVMIYAWQERLAFPNLVAKVLKTCRDCRVDHLLIENKAAGISVGQELRQALGSGSFGIQLVDPRGGDKVARLYSVQHIFSEMMVWAPDKEWAEMVIRQVSTFPKGKHDDLVDSLSQSLRYLRDTGMLTRAVERMDQIEQDRIFKGRTPAPLYPG